MKIRNLLPVAILMVLALLSSLALSNQRILNKQNTVTLGIASGEGYTVTSRNPVTVTRGENASFDISVQEGYVFLGTESGSYENGRLTIYAPERSRSIYPNVVKNCSIIAEISGSGTAELLSASVLQSGETASLKISPSENYVVERVTVNSQEHPVPKDNILNFTVWDNSHVLVEFRGKQLSFMAMSGKLGSVEIQNETSDFRYGDVLQLRCRAARDDVAFSGWSTGDFLHAGGIFLSAEPELDYTLTADSILYANFTEQSVFRLRYDANEGQMREKPEQEFSPGEYIYVASDDGSITREGYCLLEYNTEADGSGERCGLGAMLEIPRRDVTLYAQWAKETDESLLTYTADNGGITVTGLSREGAAAGLTKLVIPKSIDGRPVVSVAPGAFSDLDALQQAVVPLGVKSIGDGAFSDCPALHTVYLPESLTTMGKDVLSGSDSFTTLRVLANLGRTFDYDYDSAMADKYMRLKNSTGKRLILVGGSNLAFGVDSSLLTQKYPDYTVVNFSGSMFYGMLPLFDMLEANVRAGDIVLFVPEYEESMYANIEQESIYNWQYLESNYDILDDIDMHNNPAIFRHFVEYLNAKRSFLPGKVTNPDNVYTRAGFNAAGDLVVFRPNRYRIDFTAPDPALVQEVGIGRFNAVCARLQAQGVKCLFSFSPHPRGDLSGEEIAAETAAFREKLDGLLDSRYCTVISEMEDCFFASNLFYDTRYHMSTEGARVRTEQLLEDLAPYMND